MKIDTEILCSFIDGELDEQTAQAVRAALETDDKLQREYQSLQKTAQLVRSLPRVSAPPELAATITAHAERSQLLGPSEVGQSRPSKFRWTLSMAASLLVGATLGIFGYHAWPGRVAPPSAALEPVVVASDNYEHKDSTEMALARKPAPAGKLDPGYWSNVEETANRDGQPIAPVEDDRSNLVAGKGSAGRRIARTGPAKGAPAKSIGGAFDVDGKQIVINGQSVQTGREQEQIASTLKPSRKEAAQVLDQAATMDALAFAGDVPRSGVKSAKSGEDGLAARVSVQSALAKKKNVPLETQVLTSNVLNQGMAVNLKFEAEPLNVKVVSNDSAKTLQFVQQWAQANFLIDLNDASAKVNFPAYSQVVFQGKPGTNTEVETKNSIFVRTTRRQAQDIVNQLQQQKPTVLSVSVKDEKKLLPPLAAQPAQQQITHFAKTRELGDKDEEFKKADLQLKSKLAESASQRRSRASTSRYLYSLSNQAQVVSLDDLVTLVVLVADAPPTLKTNALTPAAPQSGQSSSPEDSNKSK